MVEGMADAIVSEAAKNIGTPAAAETPTETPDVNTETTLETTDPTTPDTPTHAREWPLRWQGPFLLSLAQKANVTTASEEVGITRTYAYEAREKQPEFARAWDEAVAAAVERLEAEAWRRAFAGVERPVFQGGTKVGVITEYSDTLMQTLLKGHAPQKYRERQSVELTGKDGGPIEHLTLDQIDAEIARLEAAGAQAPQAGTATA